jgi:hypothetical protein
MTLVLAGLLTKAKLRRSLSPQRCEINAGGGGDRGGPHHVDQLIDLMSRAIVFGLLG